MFNTMYYYLGFYVILLLVVTYLISRRQSNEDFLISGRNRGGWQILMSKFAASIGAGWFITYTGFAYEYGMGVFALLIGAIIGYPLFAFFAAPKIHRNSGKEKRYTIGDYAYGETGNNRIRVVTNWCAIAITFSWLIVGIIGGGKIISDFGFISYEWSVIITSTIVLIYLLMAGFKGVIITDFIQSIIILVLLVIVTFGIVGGNAGELLATSEILYDWPVIIGFLLFGILAVFSAADRYQLCFAAKNESILKKSLSAAVVPLIFGAFFLLFIGVFMAQTTPGLDTGLIFIEALKNFLPAGLLPVAVVLFFAGIMSSTDTGVFVVASHYSLTQGKLHPKMIRFATIVLVVILAFIALVFSDIVDVSIFAGGISLVLPIPMIYLLSGGKSSRKFFASLVGGFVGLVLGLMIFGLNPGIAITTPIVSLGGLLWKK